MTIRSEIVALYGTNGLIGMGNKVTTKSVMWVVGGVTVFAGLSADAVWVIGVAQVYVALLEDIA